MKRFFRTPGRAALSTICIVIVILGIVAAVCAVVIPRSLIDISTAEKIALSDAGLQEQDVSAMWSRLEFEDGRFLYDVNFYSDGTEYEYVIQAKDGDIAARYIEDGGNVSGQKASSQPAAAQTAPAPSQPAGETIQAEEKKEGTALQPAQELTLEEAKAAALTDAGLSAELVTFTKEKADREDGIRVYELEFYDDSAKYEYEIGASDGAVRKKDVETFGTKPGRLADSGADLGASEIGSARAQEIALNHAGLSESEVSLMRTETEYDDGRMRYEVEFYFGRTEYSYAIDAYTGDILEYDVDRD